MFLIKQNMTAARILFALLLIVCGSTLACADMAKPESQAAPASSQPPRWRYEAKDHYRFNLGGPSGEYTDWERTDMEDFEGIRATVQIDKLYGKPTDKWGSIARVALFGSGSEKDRPMLSVMFSADRRTNRVQPILSRGKNIPDEAFEPSYDVGKPIDFMIVPGAPGKLLVSFGKQAFEVPCDFDVKAVKVVGSGVDVKFEPFEFLRRIEK